MKRKQIIYLLDRTYQEILISLYNLIDILIPDYTIFSPIRKGIARLFWNIQKKTRIRKGFRVTRLRKLNIGKNCFINRNNLFDNGSDITIGDNCSLGFDNKFLTLNHIEKDKVREGNENTFYSKSIKIGNNVWITTNCVILAGSEIGDNVIVTPNSVVKGILENNFVYGGDPI